MIKILMLGMETMQVLDKYSFFDKLLMLLDGTLVECNLRLFNLNLGRTRNMKVF